MFPIQAQQFLNLLILVFFAYFFEYFYLDMKVLLVIMLVTIFVEHLFIYMKYRKLISFSFSSLTTALGVMLMMVAENIWIYVFVIALGLGQKYFVTLSGKHFFNPSNFSLLMAMFFFYNDAHIVLGQLGDELYLKIIVILLAIVILSRAERLFIPIGFIISYIIMQYFFVVTNDSTLLLEDIYLRFYSVSFILFLLFMLTDPHTTPTSFRDQIVFSIVISVLSVGLDRYYGFRVQHLFMALFLCSPFVSTFELYLEQKLDGKDMVKFILLIFLVLGVIISIESNPPYYFEMDS